MQRPVAGRMGVGHRFERSERLRRDDEQGLGRVQPLHRFGEIGAVDVRDEAKRQAAIAVMAQRLVGHHRPQIRPADADIDDVANPLAGMPQPAAAAHTIGKGGHLVEHGVYLRHDVLAIENDLFALRCAQRHVQDGAILGDVDPLAAEHGVAPRGQARFVGQLPQQAASFLR